MALQKLNKARRKTIAIVVKNQSTQKRARPIINSVAAQIVLQTGGRLTGMHKMNNIRSQRASKNSLAQTFKRASVICKFSGISSLLKRHRTHHFQLPRIY